MTAASLPCDIVSLRMAHCRAEHAAGSGQYHLAVLHYRTRISTVLLFWMAFVLTRPFGATLGDFLTKPLEKGGLDFGTVGASAFLGAILVGLVIIATQVQRKRLRAAPLPAL